jgi:membrane-associated phospholipid phosphatase
MWKRMVIAAAVVIFLCSTAYSADNIILSIDGTDLDLDFPSILNELPSVTYRYYTVKPRLAEFEIGGMVVGFNFLLLDEAYYELFHGINPFPQEFWTAVSVLGDARLHLAVGLLLVLNGSELGSDLFHVIGYNGVNTAVVKALSGMARPYLNEGAAFYGPKFASDYAAMPSGHTSSSTAAAVVLSEYYPELKGLWYAAAGMIGLSRIFLEQHWPSNVAFGAALGHASARHYLELER